MSKLLVAMKSVIPSEFVRKPRGLEEGYIIVAIIALYRPCSLAPVLLLPIQKHHKQCYHTKCFNEYSFKPKYLF